MAKRAGFGSVRQLPSGRWQARYTIPGTETMVKAPTTFGAKIDAEGWLATQRADLVRGAWLPPDNGTTLAKYAETWLAHRTLKPRTRSHYRALLDQHILPTLGATQIRKLSPVVVRQWHAQLLSDLLLAERARELDRKAKGLTPRNNPRSGATSGAHAYMLLKTMCATAVSDDLLAANPCRIRGAGQAKRVSKTEPATLDELAALVAAMPKRYQLMVLLAAWCALRFGELTELRGSDIDTKNGIIKIRRAVTWVDSQAVIGKPKSDAGIRDVAIPPHLLPALRQHLLEFGVGRDGLLFPAARTDSHMRPATLYKVFYPAREAAGRPDLRFHDLRHSGATFAAGTGATLAELMGRLGHSTPGAAMRYQHAAKGRDAEIASLLSKMSERAN